MAMALRPVSAAFKLRPLNLRTRAGSDKLCPKASSDEGGLICRVETARLLGELGAAHFRSGSDSLFDCGLVVLVLSTRGLYPSNLTGRDGFLLAACNKKKRLNHRMGKTSGKMSEK